MERRTMCQSDLWNATYAMGDVATARQSLHVVHQWETIQPPPFFFHYKQKAIKMDILFLVH